MSKLAIISRLDQGILIDMSACQSMAEAVEQLTAGLPVSNRFLPGQTVDINLGSLSLSQAELIQILALIARLGLTPREVLAFDAKTRAFIDARRYAGIDNLQVESVHAAQPSVPQISSPQTPTTILSQHETSQQQKAETPAPVLVPTTDIRQLPPLNVTFAPVQEETLSESGSSGSVTVDTTADRIVMVEDSAEAEIPEALPATSVSLSAPSDKTEKTSNPDKVPPSTLHVRQNLRSGQAVSAPGHLVLIGDVNAGAEVIAGGDITVWGALRGIAHAGVGGNKEAEIRALKLDPIQIRIGNAIARSPDYAHIKPGVLPGPETARLLDGQIRITRSYFE